MRKRKQEINDYQLGRLLANEVAWVADRVEQQYNESGKATKTGYSSLLFQPEMAKLVLLVVGQPTKMNATCMVKSPSKEPKSQSKQKVWVMKNSLNEQEMDEAGERWVNHKGPYMTVAETLAHSAERAKQTKP